MTEIRVSDLDMTYFKQRAEEERELAATASDAATRKAHENVAREFDRLLASARRLSSGTRL
jgi:F0F1-type ATP synthase epsilon subunit